jgi:hypothetical protein
MNTLGDLEAAVIEGAVQRIRPKIMTICAILFGLLPIMWSPTTQAGADVMKRIAAPMIGGVITSGILELLIYPVIFVLWRRRHLPRETRGSRSLTAERPALKPVPASPEASRRRKPLGVLIAAGLTGALAVSGYFLWKKSETAPGAGPIQPTHPVAAPNLSLGPATQLNEPRATALSALFRAADGLATALAADKPESFNEALPSLGPALDQLHQVFDPSHPWFATIHQLIAVKPAEADTLEAARTAFLAFTPRVVELANAARHHNESFRSLKIYKCPMAPKPGQTAYWMQLEGPLRNPFHGAKMLDCGSEVKP